MQRENLERLRSPQTGRKKSKKAPLCQLEYESSNTMWDPKGSSSLYEKFLVEREHNYSAPVDADREATDRIKNEAEKCIEDSLKSDSSLHRKDTNVENDLVMGIPKYYCSSGIPYDPYMGQLSVKSCKTILSEPLVKIENKTAGSVVRRVRCRNDLSDAEVGHAKTTKTVSSIIRNVSKPAAERSLKQYLERLSSVNVNELLCKLKADTDNNMLKSKAGLNSLDTLREKTNVGTSKPNNENNALPGSSPIPGKGTASVKPLGQVSMRSFANAADGTDAGRSKLEIRKGKTKYPGKVQTMRAKKDRNETEVRKYLKLRESLTVSHKGRTSIVKLMKYMGNNELPGVNSLTISQNNDENKKYECQENVQKINVNQGMASSKVKKYARYSNPLSKSGKVSTVAQKSIKQDLQRLINEGSSNANGGIIDKKPPVVSLNTIQKEKPEYKDRMQTINVNTEKRKTEAKVYAGSSEAVSKSNKGASLAERSVIQDLQHLNNNHRTKENSKTSGKNKSAVSRTRIGNGELKRKVQKTMVNSGSEKKAKTSKIIVSAKLVQQLNENDNSRVTYNIPMLLEEGWCRTCAKKCPNVVPIFGKTGVELDLLAKLKLFAANGKKWDTLPMQMCMNCISLLDNCAKFVRQMNIAETMLYKMMRTSPNPEEKSEKITTDPDGTINSEILVTYSNRAKKMGRYEMTLQPEAPKEASKHLDVRTFCSNFLFADGGAQLPNNERLPKGEVKGKDAPKEMRMNNLGNNKLGRRKRKESTDGISCNFCFQKFDTQREASEHENVHTNEIWPTVDSYYFCEYCIEVFPNIKELNDHESKVHNNVRMVHLCETCGILCDNRYDLWKHCLVDHPMHGPLECSYCSKIYPSESKLQFHIAEAHQGIFPTEEMERSYCEICGALIYTECLPSHMNSHEVPLQFKCDECDTFFDSKSQIERHIAFHTGVCPRCDKGFSNADYLQIHLTKHEIGEYPCMQCGEAFHTHREYERHLHVHREKRRNRFTYSCKLCNEFFTKGTMLWEHQKTHTRAERDEYYKQMTQCEHCKRIYLTKVHYQVHEMLVHNTQTGDLNCRICPNVSKSVEELKQHVMVHRKEILRRKVKGKCDYCGLYMTRGALLQHITTAHSNIPDVYICEYCGKQIKRLDNFRNHIGVHEGDKRYKCHICDVAFAHYNAREMHICDVHPEHMTEKQSNRKKNRKKYRADAARRDAYKNFKCHQCVEIFRSQRSRMTHVIKMHPLTAKAQLYKDALRRNREVVRKMKYRCNLCSEVFANYDRRRFHVVRTHPDSDKAREYNKALERLRLLKKKYKHRCSVCQHEFDYHYQRKAHILKNHPDSAQASAYKKNGSGKRT